MQKRLSPTKRRPAQAAPLSTHEIRTRLTAFAHQWQGGKDEKADAQTFTLRLLECYGLSEHHYLREGRVPKPDGATGYMDGFIPGKLIIEFKSLGKNLKKAAEQAFGYRFGLPPETQPTHILLCDFARFVLLDLARDTQTSWTLAELPRHADQLRFLIDDTASAIVEEREADRKAAYQLARLHQGLLNVNFTGRPLEIFLTRTLFCLFADDTGMFNQNGQFLRFLQGSRGDGDDLGPRLQKLFETLNKPEAKRQTNLDDAYANFPYVNGSLFAELSEVPGFDSPLRQTLLACAELDWKDISPAIFGAMFQGVLETDASSDTTPQHKANKAKRRDLGAHYTSERHILRAINPLFMDALRAEFKAAGNDKGKLEALLARLPSIHLFDPACGCGNFLVIAYRELRLLELQIIEKLYKPKSQRQTSLLELARYAKVSPDQLHGIEIEDSAAHIARVAILITDHQINEQSRHIGHPRPTIPLGKMPNIVCANALTTDWASVIDPQRCTYIVGNPPFVGAKFMSDEQREQTRQVFCGIHNAGLLDLVAAWYVKAARYMQANPQVRAALVSTNSITQGEQVGVLWGWMLAQGVHLQFAHRTFQWNNEGAGVAAVHCVIVGFGLQDVPDKVIFTYDNIKSEPQAVAVSRINPYLTDGPDVIAVARSKPICPVNEIVNGSIPADGGHLILGENEKTALVASEPTAVDWLRPYLGGVGFLHNEWRYCLWLKDCPPQTLRQMPQIMARVAAVQKMREKSDKLATRQKAATPTLFTENRQPETGNYLAIPRTSSENRRYVPLGYLPASVVAANDLQLVPNASLYEFGILSSLMHRAWIDVTAGRLKSDIRYSVKLTYNTFPWPDLPVQPTTKTPARTTKAKAAIEAAAQAVLDARATYQQATPPASLADLYDPLTMPADLLQAHLQLDKAVDAAYGYKGGKDEASRVAFLFGRYSALTQSAAA
ncbi:MAG: class I SAM-dependent DNA methyltransferase [Macromonas sp.]